MSSELDPCRVVSCVRLALALHTSLCLLLVCAIVSGQAQISDVKLTSTEYSLTLIFNASPAAINYTVSFRLSQGIFWKDYHLSPPYNDNSVSVVYDNLVPGSRYTVEVYENETKASNKVFQQEIATVPLRVESLAVATSGSRFLLLQWTSAHGFMYESHEINFMRQNSTWQTKYTDSQPTFNLTNLDPGYSYQVNVVSVTAGTRSLPSDEITASTLPVPPANLTARALGSSQVMVTWTPQPSSYQDYFQVAYSLESSNSQLMVTCTNSPCTFAAGPPAGQVISINVSSVSHNYTSLPATIKASTAPGLVTNLSSVAGVRSLNITWSAPISSVQAYYRLSIASIGTNFSQEHNITAVGTHANHFSNSLLGGFLYKVEVRTMTLFAAGDAKTDLFITIPETVLNLRGQAVNTTSVRLTWENPRNSAIMFLNITVKQSATDGAILVTREENSRIQDIVLSDLVPGQQYYISVSVHSQYSSSHDAAILVRTKPVKPRVVKVLAEERELAITMTREEETGVFDSFQVGLQGQRDSQISDTSGQVTFNNLDPGTEYTLVAVTISGNESSEYINRSVNTKPQQASHLTVLSDGGQAVMQATWKAPAIGGYDNFTVLITDVSGDSPAQTLSTKEKKVEIAGLQPGSTYNISVTCHKGEQTSTTIWALNTTTPLPVAHLRLSHRGMDTVTVTWDAPTGSSLSGFAFSFDYLNMTLVSVPANTTQYKLVGLKPDSNYTLKLYVYSRQPDGTPRFSKETNLTFSTYPESVAGLQKVMATSDMIMVNWTVPVSVRADNFHVGIRSLDAASPVLELALTVPGSRTNATFNGLRPGHKYVIAIRTMKTGSAIQPPQYGPSVKLAVVTKPLPVESLQLTTSTNSLMATWHMNSTSRQTQFKVVYVADNVSRSLSVQASNMTSYQANMTELFAGCQYAVTVVAVQAAEADTELSLPVSGRGYTVPLPVSEFNLSVESSEVRLTWRPPATGKWDGYQIGYRPMLHVNSSQFLLRTFPPSTSNVNITSLFPGERYHMILAVLSNNVESRKEEALATTKPLPPKDLQVVKNKTTSTAATISWVYDQSVTHASKWRFHIHGAAIDREVLATDKQQYVLLLDNLVSGQTYNVEVTSVVDNSSSQQQMLHVTTKPVINSRMEPVSSTNTSFTISFSNTVSSIYDYLSFTLMGAAGHQPVNRTNSEQSHTVNFSHLEAGTKYTVQAVAVSRGEVSDPVFLEINTDPNPVAVKLSSSDTTVTLDLIPQQKAPAQCTVTCTSTGNMTRSCGEQTTTAGQQVIFSDLTPFQEYTFIVATQTQVVKGERKQVVVEYQTKTKEGYTCAIINLGDSNFCSQNCPVCYRMCVSERNHPCVFPIDMCAPGAVTSLSARDEDLHTAVLSWQPPELTNGILRSYTVSYHGQEPSDPQYEDNKVINDVNSTSTLLKVDSLQAGFEYKFQVVALTVAPGEIAEVKLTMKTAAPAFKPGFTSETSKPTVAGPSARVVTDRQIYFEFINPFSNDNGFVKYHTVIVSRNLTADDKSPSLPSWTEARTNSNIHVYQAVGQCQDFFLVDSLCGGSGSQRAVTSSPQQQSRVFVVGAQTPAECENQQYCNGPLLANTEYYVKLRGYTTSGEFQETEYSDKIKTAETTKTGNAAVVGGIAGAAAAVVIIIIVIIVFVIRHRHHPKGTLKQAHSERISEHSHNRSSRPVKVAHFSTHVLRMSADSDFKYAEEYEDLREVGRGQSCHAAELPLNLGKNRFTNILPYDHSRVKLMSDDSQDGSDYINASYMSGYSGPREYVATQGPLAATRDDFWRMVWEQNSRNIVMLTRCQEKNKEKSDHYWPSDTVARFYGNVQVVVLSEVHMPDWTLTEMNMSVAEQSRMIRHFHYKVWPDFGVPRNPSTLIQCVRMVRENLIKEAGPIIVHCSAGVGRSGTFIVLDHVLQLIRERDEVDIFGIVYTLRQQRVLMVQTEQQYKFIHECLLCVLEGREEESIYANLGQINGGFEGC